MSTTQMSNSMIAKCAAWAGMLLTCAGLIWKASEFRSEVRTDLGWVKTSLATLVTRFNELDVLKNQVATMDRVGTDALKDVDKRVQSLSQCVSAYRDNGSPASLKLIHDLEARVSKLEQDLSVHIAINGKTKP